MVLALKTPHERTEVVLERFCYMEFEQISTFERKLDNEKAGYHVLSAVIPLGTLKELSF